MKHLTIALLTGVTPQLQNRKLTAEVFGLLTTEARHAAWARHLAGFTPVLDALDTPEPVAEVDRFVTGTHFVTSRPRTFARRQRPRFTG